MSTTVQAVEKCLRTSFNARAGSALKTEDGFSQLELVDWEVYLILNRSGVNHRRKQVPFGLILAKKNALRDRGDVLRHPVPWTLR